MIVGATVMVVLTLAVWLAAPVAQTIGLGHSEVLLGAALLAAVLAAFLSNLPLKGIARVRSVLASGAGPLSPDGQPVGISGLADDIAAALKHVETTIRNEDRALFLNAAFHTSPVPVLLASADGVLLDVNDAARKAFGDRIGGFQATAAETGAGKLPVTSLSPDLTALCTTALGRAQPVKDVEIEIDASVWSTTAFRIGPDDDTPGACGFVMSDISAKARNQALHDVLNSNELVAEFDRNGHLTQINPAFTALVGNTDRDLRRLLKEQAPGMGDIWADLSAGTPRGAVLSFSQTARTSPTACLLLLPVMDADGVLQQVLATGFSGSRPETSPDRKMAQTDAGNQALDSLTRALGSLATGKVLTRLEEPFEGRFDKLRESYNSAAEAIDWSAGATAVAAKSVSQGCSEMARCAQEMKSLSETQSGVLERGSAALEGLNGNAEIAVDRSKGAKSFVDQVLVSTGDSGQVVQDAVGAMGEIEQSSQRISQIIGVIEDIAFQTNLLALNAGVEAARAGDSGRGFAVVATEVRALAQRSSDAAKEIKDLISESASQVAEGVSLVTRAGEVLTHVTSEIVAMDEQVGEIAEISAQQSGEIKGFAGALSEIGEISERFSTTLGKSVDLLEQATRSARALETSQRPAAPPREPREGQGRTVIAKAKAPPEFRRNTKPSGTSSEDPGPQKAVARQARMPAARETAAAVYDSGWEDF